LNATQDIDDPSVSGLFSFIYINLAASPIPKQHRTCIKKEEEYNTQAPMSTTTTTTTTEIKSESQPQTKAQNGAEHQTRHSEVGHKSLLQSDALYQVGNQA